MDPDSSELSITPLDHSHDLSDFDSGSPARDAWLRTRALPGQVSGDAMTQVVMRDGRIAGYYALSTAAVLRSVLPGALRRNAPDPVPTLLIGQLAVDLRCQGRGIGSALVYDAMGRALRVAQFAGWRLLVVSPDGAQAEAFWTKFDFVAVPGVTPALMALTQTRVRRLLAVPP